MSLDAKSKRALRALADKEFGGNLSALVTDFAEEARRRMAAGEFLRMRGVPRITAPEAERLAAQIERETVAFRRRKRRRAA